MKRNAMLWVLTAVAALSLVGCADSKGVGAPSAIPAGGPAQELGEGVTDETLANAGWTCLQLPNGVILCGPPGSGLPPVPRAADGRPTYNIMAFTRDHQFLHHVKLLRPDLYHGQPCLGGAPWIYQAFLNYYECIIPGQGE